MADAVHHVAAAHDDAEHGHAPHLQHHFETPAQQFDASKLGMWVFLVTEVLFFSGLFCAYAVYRRTHPEIFEVGHHFLDKKMGALNTAILITSSFTMALGVWCAQKSLKRGLIVCLALTLAGGAGFMTVKYFEYADKIEHGKVWGAGFNPQYPGEHAAPRHASVPQAQPSDHADDSRHAAPAATQSDQPEQQAQQASGAQHVASTAQEGNPAPTTQAAAASNALPLETSQIKPAPPGPPGLRWPPRHAQARQQVDEAALYAEAKRMRDLHIFMAIYFALTGLHGLHVLAGMGVLTWLLIGAIKGRYDGTYYTPVDLGGLYWHLVDLIWIFLFPLLYLIH